MSKKNKRIFIAVWLVIIALLCVAAVLVGNAGEGESIKVAMRDAVLHEENTVSLFGLMNVNPAFISAMLVTVVILAFAAVVRIFVVPHFKYIPGKFQLFLETVVGLFDGMAKSNSPHRNGFLGAYIFAAGVYIFIGTLFELFGIQVMTVNGTPIALPAPLSDINAAIAMGCLSYSVILAGGVRANKLRGLGNTLKDFSLPISMSFRLFGALLSGLLVTELVYHYVNLSFVLPVIVAVLFTLLHALIQAYVLTMLTALFYGEVTEPHEGHGKNGKKNKKSKKIMANA